MQGFPTDRPSSPSWSSSSHDYDHNTELPSVSYGDGDPRSPDAFMSNRRTPFQRAPVSHQEMFSLQQRLENLSAQQLHMLKKALAECQKGQRGRQSESQGRGRSCSQQEKGNWGLRDQSKSQYEQVGFLSKSRWASPVTEFVTHLSTASTAVHLNGESTFPGLWSS